MTVNHLIYNTVGYKNEFSFSRKNESKQNMSQRVRQIPDLIPKLQAKKALVHI